MPTIMLRGTTSPPLLSYHRRPRHPLHQIVAVLTRSFGMATVTVSSDGVGMHHHFSPIVLMGLSQKLSAVQFGFRFHALWLM